MGFLLKLEKGKSHIIRKLVEALSGVVSETVLETSPSEFTVTAIDPGRNALLKLQIPKESFDGFKSSEKAKAGINLADFDKIMKRLTSEDSLELFYDEKDVSIKISMRRSEQRTRTFHLALIDLEVEELPIDKLLQADYSAGFIIEPDFFEEAVKDAEVYSETITMEAIKNKKIGFSSFGAVGHMSYDIGVSEFETCDIENNCKASFGLSVLKNIFKVSSIVEKLQIALSSDHPLAMVMQLEGGGILYFLVAPRVEYEEDIEDE